MLTIFAMPKPFEGHIGLIQRNAIRSWTYLDPRPEIILFGNESGIAEISQEFGLLHVPGVERNEFGTPLLRSLIQQTEAKAGSQRLCYVNADIILMGDFMDAVRQVANRHRGFLMAGRRYDLDIRELLQFTPGWQEGLRQTVTQRGRLDPPGSIDYFLFPKRFWKKLPPLAIGRFYWDNWLLYQARAQRAALIDATDAVMIVHQRHGYSHTSLGAEGLQPADGTDQLRRGPEAVRNLEIAGGEHHLYNLNDATHLLTPQGLVERGFGPHTVERLQISWNVRRRCALHLLERSSSPNSYFGYPARGLLWLIRATTPVRQRLGRAITQWRDKV